MKSLSIELHDIILSKQNEINYDPQYKSYIEAIDEFNEMVSLGILKPRGNNLLSIQDAHLSNKYSYNTSLKNGA